MTINELLIELLKCPDKNAVVEYKNMEIDDTCTISKVEIKYNIYIVNGSKYKVILN